MRIVYRVTEGDFVEARRLFVASEKWSRRTSRRIMPWMGGLMLLLSFLILVLARDSMGALPIGLMGAYFLYCGFALQRIFRKLYRNDKRFGQEVTADITEDGVHVVTALADTYMKWDAIVRFSESERIFMFFYAEWTFSVVPKRAFPPSEIADFRDLLRRKIPSPVAS